LLLLLELLREGVVVVLGAVERCGCVLLLLGVVVVERVELLGAV